MKYFTLALFLTTLAFQGFGQKVKYKDLFILLNAKRYEEAEPFLRIFLSDEKNEDNGNAYLHMGNIYHEKALASDILSDDNHSLLYADSSIQFYKNAIIYITDKEIRKNDEYYEEYLRRDLRTGKVEIKLSDIHFDLQKRIEDIQGRKEKIKNLKISFDNYSRFYNKSANSFAALKQNFGSSRILYLRGDEEVLKTLGEIKSSYESSISSFKNYRNLLDESPGMVYDQHWEEVEIDDFGAAEIDIDFKAPRIRASNLGKWAEETQYIIEKEIRPLKKKLIEFDLLLDNLYSRITSDSVSVRSDIEELAQDLPAGQLEKYDPNPFPINLLKIRISELDYLSSIIEYNFTKDSADLYYQKSELQKLIERLGELDKQIKAFKEINIDLEAPNYPTFVTERYKSTDKINEFILKKEETITSESDRLSKEYALVEHSLRFMVYNEDTIPITMDFPDSISSNYLPLKVEEEKYAIGLHMSGQKLTGGFFTDINPERRSKIKVDIALDTAKFLTSKIPLTEIISANDLDEQIFYLAILQPEDSTASRYNTAVSKIYKADGLAWTKTFTWNNKPSDLFYQPDSGDLILSFENEENPVVITIDGEVRKN